MYFKSVKQDKNKYSVTVIFGVLLFVIGLIGVIWAINKKSSNGTFNEGALTSFGTAHDLLVPSIIVLVLSLCLILVNRRSK